MRRAQSTLEYAIMIATVVAALLCMQTYIKRGLQGKFRVTVDELGEQYDPANTRGNIVISKDSDITTTIETDEETSKTTTTETIHTDEESRYGHETVGNL